MAPSLPSYQDATARVDWLELVAPYIDFGDYRALCLVSRVYWKVFAPLLWNDLFSAARLSGLDPSDDISWWMSFVFTKLPNVRPETRYLVRVLDARHFATEAYHFASDQGERTLPQSFRNALTLLDNVDCIVLAGHGDLDAGFVLTPQLANPSRRGPRILSIADCPFHLPGNFFSFPYLQELVHLDVSRIPGSISHLIGPTLLPQLRVLKISGREIDDAALAALLGTFRLRLWSLDLSNNKISDASIEHLLKMCFPATNLRTDAYSEVEGRLVHGAVGNIYHEPFISLAESDWSGAFAHPQRYLADAPAYTAELHTESFDHRVTRSDGRHPILQDSVESINKILSGMDAHHQTESLQVSRGLTHLHISNNHISSVGLVRLLQGSNGQLESFSCDSMPLFPQSSPTPAYWPKSVSLYGVLGAAHVFRPVFSPNLRVLRIHHSLVTRCLTLETEGMSMLTRSYLSEVSLLPRIQQAYAQAFIPDLNPRLTSLTLTCVPRRSCGPLIKALIYFLRQLSEQEQSIRNATKAVLWRGPRLLQGLRHLRLEFEPDPMEEGFSTSEDLDAEELLNSGDPGFSFFDERKRNPTSRTRPGVNVGEPERTSTTNHNESPTILDNETHLIYNGHWNGEKFSVPVWIGKQPMQPDSVIYTYRRLVIDYGLRDGVGPATPCQIAAGAPKDSYIFHTAWCASIMPQQLRPPPTKQLAAMKDVIQELKRFRLASKAQYTESPQQTSRPASLEHHLHFWTGKLEVSMEQPIPHSRATKYWR